MPGSSAQNYQATVAWINRQSGLGPHGIWWENSERLREDYGGRWNVQRRCAKVMQRKIRDATTSPEIDADWNAIRGGRWFVPVGGGIGKVLAIGNQAFIGIVLVYRNVVGPTTVPSPKWTMNVQLALLIPKQRSKRNCPRRRFAAETSFKHCAPCSFVLVGYA